MKLLALGVINVRVDVEGARTDVKINQESVVVNINKSKTLDGPILGEECITIAGSPTICEEIGGLSFEISPLSFYQVNRQQMVKLYDKALEYASLKGDETVLDLYCGVGTIGLFAAAEMKRKTIEHNEAEGKDAESRRLASAGAPASDQSEDSETGCDAPGKVEGSGLQWVSSEELEFSRTDCAPPKKAKIGRVIGIESVKGAVLDANRNAVINGIVNARYVCGKAEEELPKMVRTKAQEEKAVREATFRFGAEAGKKEILKDESLRITHADVAILDPPRAGCDQVLLEAVVKVQPDRIVYVSCDPATLARDVKWLGEHGYEFKEATPCDMFPWTGHVETIVLLQRETL